MNFKNKIGFFLPITGLIVLMIGLSGALYVVQLQQKNSRLLDVNVSSIRTAEGLELIIRDMRHDLDRYLLTQDQNYLEHASQRHADVSDWLSKAKQLAASDQEHAFITELENGLNEYFRQLTLLTDSESKVISAQVVNSLEEEILSNHILVTAHKFLDFNETELEQSNLQHQHLANKLAMVMVLLGCCGAVAGLEAGYIVTRMINRSMFMLSVPIRDVAGKLNTVVGPVRVSTDPSVQDLQNVLETVSKQVGSVVEQLHLRHQEVVRADQLAVLGKLAAGLAHELRNPLMCMKTLVQSARREKDHASLDANDLAVLNEEITRVDSLLQSFLDFARPPELLFKPVEVVPMIRQIIDLVSSRAAARQIDIESRLPFEHLIVQGDAAQLRQVLLNLLLNALDAVANGGQIIVSVQRLGHASKTGDGNAVALQTVGSGERPTEFWGSISVTDNGCGLPEADRDRIYEPFFSTKAPGVGLGLSVSKRIVDVHGGELFAEDRPGGGTVFTIKLPMSQRHAVAT
ncbi:MAG: hypothetical protein KDB00_27455 [Planctomycetales bacterium]|nr:hypothetical protein [Planctomycetales bacterium]